MFSDLSSLPFLSSTTYSLLYRHGTSFRAHICSWSRHSLSTLYSWHCDNGNWSIVVLYSFNAIRLSALHLRVISGICFPPILSIAQVSLGRRRHMLLDRSLPCPARGLVLPRCSASAKPLLCGIDCCKGMRESVQRTQLWVVVITLRKGAKSKHIRILVAPARTRKLRQCSKVVSYSVLTSLLQVISRL